jgi:integrase
MLGLLGLRIFEACGSNITDVGEEHGHRVLRVVGKGSKVVLAPLPPAVGRAIDRAIRDRVSGPILLNQRGRRMDRHAATRRLRRLAEVSVVRLPRMHPHMLRHTFALKMLVTLDRALDRRFGLDRSERDHARKVYGDAFALVKDLLGHSSEETTRTIYLAPLNGLRLRSILDGNEGEDLDAILTRVAHASRLVMDVNPTAEDV